MPDSKLFASSEFRDLAFFYLSPFEPERFYSKFQYCDKSNWPKEINSWAPKRKIEFLAGRYCALSALSSLQSSVQQTSLYQTIDCCDIAQIPIADNRSPIWPMGYLGSISHCDDKLGAVVANVSDYHAIGFDIEKVQSFKRANDLTSLVLTEDELFLWKTIAKDNVLSFGQFFSLVFSAKESFYKAYSSYFSTFCNGNSYLLSKDPYIEPKALDFKHCSLKNINWENGEFSLDFFQSPLNDLVLKGFFKLNQTHIDSLVIFPQS